MKIYISNLGAKITGASLEAVFSVFGQISNSQLLSAKESGKANAMAWMEMPNEQEATVALQRMNGAILDGQRIVVTQSIKETNLTLDRIHNKSSL